MTNPPSVLLLALDTSGPGVLAALARDGRSRVREAAASNARGEELDLEVAALLAEAGAACAEIDAVAAVVGPGSYTGLRCGLAFLRGVAYGREVRAVAVGALELLAFRSSEVGEDLGVIAATGDRAFVATRYRRLGDLADEIAAPHALAAADLPALLEEWRAAGVRSAAIADDEACTLAAALVEAGLARAAERETKADALVRIALGKIDAGHTLPLAELLPVYVGLSSARPNRHGVASAFAPK